MAMGVFAAAMTFAVGAFTQALKTQRIVNHLMSVNSNASLAIEQIAREIRTGYNFGYNDKVTDCFNVGWTELKFKNHRGDVVVYKQNNNAIERGVCRPTVKDCSLQANFDFASLTASNVMINNLCFITTKIDKCDPWRITLLFKSGSARSELASNALDIQTTISARILPKEAPFDYAFNTCPLQ